MRKPNTLVILLLIMSLLLAPGCATESSAMSPVSEALQRDAKAYAEAHDVPLDEAIRRLRQQDPVGELNAVLQEQEAGVFGGLWIQHEPEYKVIVLVTDDQRRIRRRYVQGGPLEEMVEIRQAETTLEELHTIQQETMGILEEIDSRAKTAIDVKRDCVSLFVADPESLQAELDAAGVKLPDHVCIEPTAPPSEASTRTPASLESLTVVTAAGLTVEEYAIVSATVDTPQGFEFLDRIPKDVLARRAAWRDFDAERRLSRLNETLSPFDCRLTAEENAGWRGASYDFHCEDRQILSNPRRVWSVSVNASGTDFAFVAENAPNKSPGYLLVQKDTVHPLSDWGYVVPVYRGDELLTLERLDDGQFAVKQGDEILYTYRDRGIRADRPIKRLLTEGENWILEARDEVIVNGESLNQRLDVDEILHYIILQGQPLFFFERGSQVRVSYGGETLPVVYDEVVHYQCCEPAMFNVRSNEHMLWFYALREGIWHYVEIGSYTDD